MADSHVLTAVVPVEIKRRELHSRALLAMHLARAGWRTVLCQVQRMPDWLPALAPYCLLDLRVPHTDYFRQLYTGPGGAILPVDEEVGVVDRDPWLARRHPAEGIAAIDGMFTWGPIHQDFLVRSFPDRAADFIASGNPRVDAWKPRYASLYDCPVDEPFILFNMTFTSVNHYLGQHATKLRPDPKNSHYLNEEAHRAYHQRLLDEFLAAIEHLADRYRDARLVVRPHPAENIQFYRERFARHRNILVCNDGDVMGWLHRCVAMVHHGCTTGVQAAVARRQSLFYAPQLDMQFLHDITLDVSRQIESLDELTTVIGERLQAGPGAPHPVDLTLLAPYFANLDSEAAPAIVATLDQRHDALLEAIRSRRGGQLPTPAKPPTVWSRTRRQLSLRVKGLLRRDIRAISGYVKHKLPGIPVEELREQHRRLCAIDPAFAGIAIEALEPNVLSLQRS